VRHELRERLLPLLCFGALAAATPAAIELALGRDPVQLSARLHVFAVGFTALAAAVAAVALSIAGARRRDARAVLTATAFAIMAGLLALHGLATPGIFVGVNGVIAVTGGLTLPAGGVILLLSTLAPPRLLRRVGPLLVLEAAMISGLLALGASALVYPDIVPQVPAPNSFSALALLAFGLMVYGLLILRSLRTFLLTRRLADLGVVVGLVWLATALVPALTMTYDQLGWWVGHELELDGILVVGVIVALDLARSTQSRSLAGDLKATELVGAEEVFLGSNVRALTSRLAEKDEYTERHARRVALLAVQVGEMLGLKAGRLRALAIGGLVHDIGKLSIPDAILKKPGPLDDREFEAIRRHPDSGSRLLQELGGFSETVRRLVRDHHERLDGDGYPRRLTEGELDLETRILTVCDVYDALISPRVYRPAWTHEEAVALLHREAGTAFDPRCVAAVEQVLIRESASAAPRGRELPLAQDSPRRG
jgi:HD-GYP domain-containing protein (c-di-GMP phosphodiesterase class II)